MKIEELHIGMKVKHPQYGAGTIRTIGEHTAQIKFDDGEERTVAPEAAGLAPAEAQAHLSGLTMPLAQLVSQLIAAVADHAGIERPDAVVPQLGHRWLKGTLVLRPGDPSLQAKEVPIETFFHKIVMMRNNFRVLEQKINSHSQLTDADKIDLQQYISRCYGSMTTFNVLFRNDADEFRS